ncbi:PilZ domain-containing protein [Treponema sp. OttesenSCG-928-L16]|nr:PilZ domain-containing protein [Treponema sp. OttesenSCG-928-L16]
MIPYLALIVIPLFFVVVLLLAGSNKDKTEKASWIQFYAKGKDAGFSFKEIELLRQLAVKADLEEPSSLFFSQEQLDRCIKSFLRKIRLSGEDKQVSTQDFLSKLYEYRKKIEMEKPRNKKGITSSRSISEGQALRVLVSGSGVFQSRVVKNTNQYMTISRPTSPNIPPNFSWAGLSLALYFWRQDDAGYVFDTYVLEEVYSKGLSSLKISHSDSLFRTQKRKSVRVKTHKNAFLYLMKAEDAISGLETKPGLKCIVEDLSDSGCAVTIGGRALPGLRVKIQFSLDNTAIGMSGTVRSLEYDEAANRSLLHIEADPLSLETRNKILGEVFGLHSNEDYLVPFDLLDEEEKNEKHRSDAKGEVI